MQKRVTDLDREAQTRTTRRPADVFSRHPLQFVRDGERVWIIDYEYAAAGQPLLDLAVLSMG